MLEPRIASGGLFLPVIFGGPEGRNVMARNQFAHPARRTKPTVSTNQSARHHQADMIQITYSLPLCQICLIDDHET
ncbi:hypothetical protein BDV59DRAFT_189963 [Aspergillus ambiguus]|uniref:uncharacterized protein n=1 Tax=Aspergillus ambiguus TaxID=176160 RepID=UPI003CCCACB7